MSRIFISYRREDAPGHAGRLYDRLTAHFGQDQVFMDIDTIEPGEDFVTAIEIGVGSVDALLAVIGRSWLDVLDPDTGRRRLENANDFVRLEIKTALERKIRVIPVLVQQASMPLETELPADVAGLARRNALQLPDLHWKAGVDRLIETVAKILDQHRVAQAERHASPAESGRVTKPPSRSNTPAAPEFKPVEPDRRETVRPRAPDRAKTVIVHGVEAREIRCLEHDFPVGDVALSRDGRSVATAGPKEAIVWSAETGGTITRLTRGGKIAFSPDGTRLATAGDNTGTLWDVAGGKEIAQMSHSKTITAIAFSPDGHYLATGSMDQTARVWDAKGGGAVVLLPHNGWVSAVDFSPESGRLATASWEGVSRVWEAERGRELARVNHGFWSSNATHVAFSPDGGKVISAAGRIVSVWEAASGTIAVELKHEGIGTSIGGIALSADGELLATFTVLGREAHLWRIADAREVARLPHEDFVSALRFDPLGRYFATASRDGAGRIWDLQGRQLASLPHRGAVTDLAVSADGIRLATTGEDKTTRVWELR